MQADAAAYLTRTGHTDLLPVLGLAPSPPPRRPLYFLPKLEGRGEGRCMCAPRGRRYRLCPVHGEPQFRTAEEETR